MKFRFWYLVSSLILFLILGICYFHEVTHNFDTEVRIEKDGQLWRVKSSTNNNNHLEVGDVVTNISWSNSNGSERLDKYLVLVNAKEVEKEDDVGGREVIRLSSESNLWNYFVMLIVASALWVFSACITIRKQISRQSFDFSIALMAISFFVLSLVPSSQGNPIARIIIITFICLVPYYVFRFLNRLKINRVNNISYVLIRIFLIIGLVTTILLSIWNTFYTLNYNLVAYLSTPIFYWAIVNLLIVLSDFYYRIRTEIDSRVNFPLITILSIAPLYWLYIVPSHHRVSYLVTMFFLLFPVLTILHILIISRYVGVSYRIKKRHFLLFLSLVFSIVSYALSQFIQSQHLIFTLCYSFLFFYSLFPIIVEIYQVITKEYTGNGIDLFLVTEKERERIAESIHDSVIQDITFAKRQIEELGEDNQEVILTQLDDVIYSLRELCSDIYPLMLKEIGLYQTIFNLAREFEMKYPVEITLDIDKEVTFPQNIESFILRSIKELFSNSVKHGRADKIELKIFGSRQRNRIEVIDNGVYKKQEKDSSYHMGLGIIREKVEQYGGRLELNTNDGTQVILEIPIGE